MQVIKNGIEYNFNFSIEAAIEAEERGYNIFEGLDALTTPKGQISLKGINDALKAMFNKGLPELIHAGFTIEEIAGQNGIIVNAINEAGFISASKDGDISPEITADPIA